VASAQTTGGITCPNGANGEPFDIELAFTDGSGVESDASAPVTMICADVPESPAAPVLLLGSLDLILIEWEPPADGGSPILGYEILMRSID
jgi:hypothetical protein